ncbi:nocturnin isoform x1 [Nannochloropsis oceanica]
MEWGLRRVKILEEITRWQPDVVTLQEVDHFFDDLQPALQRLGYTGLFVRKPLNADGAATFVKTSSLEVVSSHAYSYLEEEEEEGEGGSEGGVRSRPSNQVALAVMVRNRKGRGRRKGEEEEEEKGRREEWLVVNTHLKAMKTAAGEQVRASQARQLVAHIRAQREAYSRAHGRSLPVLLCGDFNAAPHDKEGRVTSPSLPPSSSPFPRRRRRRRRKGGIQS